MPRNIRILISALIASSISSSHANVKFDRVEREELSREARAAQLCRKLPGYDWFQTEFIFEKDTTVGYVNFDPESLYVRIRAKRSRLVDAAWWWNPLDKNKRPTLDWYAFRRTYESAAMVISRHHWLAEWKRALPGRSIELWAIGTNIGEPPDEIEKFVFPAWKDAGFKGRPEYHVLARRPSGGNSTIYFSGNEPRALITSNFVYPRDQGDTYWMSRTEFNFHPRGKRDEPYSKYFVVNPSGAWQMRTYSKAAPGGGKKPRAVSYFGGDGSTFDKAIVIVADSEKTGVDAEHDYIDKHFPGSHRGSQSLLQRGGKSFDVLEFGAADGKQRTLYFDITSFLGKLN
jgi:hypothetical protein